MSGKGNGANGNGSGQSLGDAHAFIGGGVGQQDGERSLVIARQKIVGAQAFGKLRGDCSQRRFADGGAVFLIKQAKVRVCGRKQPLARQYEGHPTGVD